MKSDVRLICLDFDGTAVDYQGEETFFHAGIVELLNGLADRGVTWCTNSGRDAADQRRILEWSQARGLKYLPAALLCSECYIFERSDGSYNPSEPWNSSAQRLLLGFNQQVQSILRPRLQEWDREYGLQTYIGETYSVFNMPDEDMRPRRFAEALTATVCGIPGAAVTRNGGWVAVLPRQMGKGNVLRGFLEKANLSPAEALAVGDHINDISMLDGTAAHHVGCPGNAVPEVVEVVRGAGGLVAAGHGPAGTLEILRRFLGGSARGETI